MNLNIYLETTIVSYLTAWPSRDLITAAHQQITREWWETKRGDFDLYVSQLVIQESSLGDSDAAKRRLQVLDDIPLLDVSQEAVNLGEDFVKLLPLPRSASVDALHIAVATVNGMDYLLTWNCTHIANAALRSKIEDVSRSRGYEPPVICTPEELMED